MTDDGADERLVQQTTGVRGGLVVGALLGVGVFAASFDWFPLATWAAWVGSFGDGAAVPFVAVLLLMPFADDVWLPRLLRPVVSMRDVVSDEMSRARATLLRRPLITGLVAGFVTSKTILVVMWGALAEDNQPAGAGRGGLYGLAVAVIVLGALALCGRLIDRRRARETAPTSAR